MKKKNLHGRILRDKLKEQQLNTVPKFYSLFFSLILFCFINKQLFYFLLFNNLIVTRWERGLKS